MEKIRKINFPKIALCIGLLVAVFFAFSPQGLAQENTNVFEITLSGDVDSGMAAYVERAVKEVGNDPNNTIIININSYGGYVNDADTIKSLISGTKAKTIAYVNDKAISAGALIALSCDEIVMSPAGTIGAAEPRVGNKKADEKMVSYWSAQLRTTAEQNGKNGEIAAGMADSSIVIPGVKEKGKLITLTTEEAINLKMADNVAKNVDEIYTLYNLDGEGKNFEHTGGEKFAEFLTSPVVAPILLTIGIAGIILEIFFSGFGIAGIVGITSLLLYFFGGYLAGSTSVIVFILFGAAIILIVAEIFITPGFGVLGVAGIIAMLAAILITSGSFAVAVVNILIALLVTLLLIAISLKWGKTRRIWGKFVLKEKTSKEKGYISEAKDLQYYLGKQGETLTIMRPAGVVLIEGKRVDAVTQGDYIGKGEMVEVILVDSGRIVVKKINN